MWQWFRDESLVEFNRIYKLLGVEFDSLNGEAFYNDKMDEAVQILEEKACWKSLRVLALLRLDDVNLPPAMIKKSDGATLYITRDIATAIYRARTYNFVKNIYAVGPRTIQPLPSVESCSEENGIWLERRYGSRWLWFGDKNPKNCQLVKEISSFSNQLFKKPSLVPKRRSKKESWIGKQRKKWHIAVGVGAVKFYDLKTDRRNGYDFDLEAMVSFEGETGPYVQYAYARIQSILRKANFTPSTDATYSLSDPESWEIIKLLQDFSRVVKRAAENYDPSLIAKYAINLAQAFNKYYAHTRILDESPERESRLALSYSTAVVLKEALRLLGVDAPEKM